MRIKWAVSAAALGMALLAGCATLPEVQRADALWMKGEKLKAIQTLQSALRGGNLFPSQRETIQARINDFKSSLASDALTKAAKPMASGTIPGVSNALAILTSYLPYDTPDGRLRTKADEYQATLDRMSQQRNQYRTRALAARRANQWSEAHRLQMGAEQLDPALRGGGDALLKARDAYYSSLVGDAIRRGNRTDAQKWLAQYQNEKPAPAGPILQTLERQIGDLQEKERAAQIEQCLEKQQYYKAFVLASGAQVADQARIDSIRNAGAAFYLAKAKEEQAAGSNRLGYAYFAVQKAYALGSGLPAFKDEAFALHQNMSDEMDKQIELRIGILSFESPADAPGEGSAFSEALYQHLLKGLPYGVRIVERSELARLQAESTGDLKGLSDRARARMLVAGSVVTLQIEHQKHEWTAHEVLPTGETRQEPNPEFQKLLSQYGPKIYRWPERPSETIHTPVYEKIPIRKGRDTVTGLGKAQMRIFDTDVGYITGAQEFEERQTAEDTFSDEVPQANIAPDVLELKSDIDIKEDIRKGLVGRVAPTVIQAYDKRERRYWERARWHVGRREMDQALLELARGHHYCVKDLDYLDNQGNNTYYREIRKAGLLDLTE